MRGGEERREARRGGRRLPEVCQGRNVWGGGAPLRLRAFRNTVT